MFNSIKILLCLLPAIVFPFSPSSTRLFPVVSAQRQLRIHIMVPSIQPPPLYINHSVPMKIQQYVQLTRVQKNFIPTSVLILLSGFIGNPHWKQWIFTKTFASVFTIVHLITSSSMVINDIFDLRIDRVNKPTRPLASGKVSLQEAIALFTGMCVACVYIGRSQIPASLHPFWVSSLVLVTTYTPIFKQITFLKNVVCAGIVTLTVPFVGLATAGLPSLQTLSSLQSLQSLPWMLFFMNILFIHSICNEILLDMLDVEGDALYGIPTLPVIFGKQRVIRFVLMGLYGNAGIITLSILLTRNYKKIAFMMSTFTITQRRLFTHIYGVVSHYFSEQKIRDALSSSTDSLLFCFFMYLLYTMS